MSAATTPYLPLRRTSDGLNQVPVNVETMPAAEVVKSTREALERHKARMNRLASERQAQADLYRSLA